MDTLRISGYFIPLYKNVMGIINEIENEINNNILKIRKSVSLEAGYTNIIILAIRTNRLGIHLNLNLKIALSIMNNIKETPIPEKRLPNFQKIIFSGKYWSEGSN
jgi:hypothetical protein